MQISATFVRGLVLGDVDGPSSLVASLSMVAESFKGRIDTAAPYGVRWGTQSVLVAALSHFPELELLGSG
jgi:hypothetical protein